ncbi:MAG: adenosylmethionine decarboxylase [Sandaracinaceae bacterium]|nr:adenosylmethionine decarboxylase [Sandaracinaceae bacterium]
MTHTFFEGPEKKVELAVVDGHPSLRGLGDAFWRGVVRAAQAEVLSVISNDHLDAYLLSESSLFVYDGFVTMITCGKTTLVEAVDAMLERIPPKAISVLVYERKNEHFPHEQPTSFFEDGRRLVTRLPGRAVRFGVEHEHAVRMFHTTREHRPEPDDRTLEILMHGIDPKRTEPFRGPRPEGGIAHALGLDLALAGHTVDEHFFEPTGYSLNAIRDAAYTTLHVTPQRLGSYVSFETNAADFRGHLQELVCEVVGVFAPESFDVVVFEPHEAPIELQLDGYVVRKHVREPVCGYHVSFRHFFRDATGPTRAVEIPMR